MILVGLLVAIPAALALAPPWGIDRWTDRRGRGGRDRRGDRHRLRQDRQLPGRPLQGRDRPSDFPEGIKSALEWFNEEEPTDARIAVVGGRPGFKQYVFYGDDLSNHVQYVADHRSHGGFFPIETCEAWREALNDGGYDYVVIGPDQRTQGESPIEAAVDRGGR